MDSRPKKPEIDTKGFDEVYPFQQTFAVAGTSHSGGLCGPFNALFLTKFFASKSLNEFKKPDYVDLYKQGVAVENKMINLEKDGDDGDALVFNELGMASKMETVDAPQVMKQLEKTQAALLTYKTSSGVPHQLAFARSSDQCVIFDSNRFFAIGKPALGMQMLKTIIDRSDPEHVKMNYTQRS